MECRKNIYDFSSSVSIIDSQPGKKRGELYFIGQSCIFVPEGGLMILQYTYFSLGCFCNTE